jgi:oxygen-dependent protoporphyrinogen oxidase
VIIIVGGGITGLAAAFELASRNVPFTLLEASSRPGGLIRTEHAEGFTIEAGPDSMLVQKPAAVELCEALGLGPRLISTTPPRIAFVLKRGRLYPLPSPSVLGIPTTWQGLARYELLSRFGRARLAAEPLVRSRRDHGEESVGSFFARRFGAETVGLIAEPLLGGIHAGDIDRLSMLSLFPRLVEAEARRGSVLRSFWNTRSAAAGDGLFRSLAGGMGELVEALARRIPEGSMRCNAAVTAIARGEDGWHVTTAAGEVAGRTVILATSARVCAPLLRPLDERAASLCADVPYVSTVSVALAFPRSAVAHPLAASGFVVARAHNALRTTACTFVSSKWAGRAPAGSVLLRVFAGGAHDPEIVDLSDNEIVDLVVREMREVLGTTGPPALTRVFRWRLAGAQHNVGQIARTSEIETRLARLGGVFVAGSGFRWVGLPDCIIDGRAAAAAAAAGSDRGQTGVRPGSDRGQTQSSNGD